MTDDSGLHGHPELQLLFGAIGMFALGAVAGIVLNETVLDYEVPWYISGSVGGVVGCIIWAVWQRHAYSAVD
jgi:hypothetical protein